MKTTFLKLIILVFVSRTAYSIPSCQYLFETPPRTQLIPIKSVGTHEKFYIYIPDPENLESAVIYDKNYNFYFPQHYIAIKLLIRAFETISFEFKFIHPDRLESSIPTRQNIKLIYSRETQSLHLEWCIKNN